MARLLTPEDFGVFAMVVPLGVIAGNATNQCIQTALLQHRVVEDRTLDEYYRFAVVVAVCAALAMCALGVALAQFYGEPRVTKVAVAWALVIALMSRAAIQEALLKRELHFPIVLAVQLSTLTLGLVVAVVAAWWGLGYWSLPLQILVMEVSRVVVMNVVSAWRPRVGWRWPGAAAAPLRRVWLSLFGLRMATWLNDQPDLAAVGRLGGSPVLGSYDTARRWAWYPFEEPFLALTEVTIAALGRVRDDAERFRHLVTRSILVMLTASLPAIAFVGVEAASTVHVFLGDQWHAAVPYLRVLCVAAFVGSISRTSQWIFLAHGLNIRLLRWSLLFQAPATVLAVVVGLQWGTMGVAVAMTLLATVLMIPAVSYGVRGTSVTLSDVLRAAARPAFASLVAALAIWLSSGLLPPAAGPARLVTSLGAYTIVFVLTWLGLPGGRRDTLALFTVLKDLSFRGGSART